MCIEKIYLHNSTENRNSDTKLFRSFNVLKLAK